jgi:hypothetical protein
MQGFVYIMTSKAMPGLVKVGMTTRGPWERAAELSTGSGAPSPFTVARAFPVHDAAKAEALCHEALSHLRHSPSREFFRCQPEDAEAQVLLALEEAELLDALLCDVNAGGVSFLREEWKQLKGEVASLRTALTDALRGNQKLKEELAESRRETTKALDYVEALRANLRRLEAEQGS